MTLNSIIQACYLKRKISQKIYFFVILLTLFTLCPFADDDINVQIVTSQNSYSPDDTIILGLTVKIPYDYHLYGNPLGPGIGKPLSISNNSNQINWLEIRKLPPKKFSPTIGKWVWAYEKETNFFLIGTILNKDAKEISGTFSFKGLICKTACIPVNKEIPYKITIDKERKITDAFFSDKMLNEKFKSAIEKMQFETENESPQDVSILNDINFSKVSVALNTSSMQQVISSNTRDYSPREKKVEFNLWIAIIFGFIAGVILNFMPCVLPVLGIKVMSFSKGNEDSRSKVIMKSSAFAAGVMAVFIILASLASFAKFSWGEQFQHPFFLISIIVLIVLFALWLFDIFIFTVPGSISSLERKSGQGITGDFFRGVFATILATPCSGPLLGATLAWALTQSTVIIYVVFMSIGIGMATPYVLLSSSKTISKLMPKPGKWMKDFKNLMGFILLGFAVYLLIGLPTDMIASAIGICMVIVFSILFYMRFAPWGISSNKQKIISASLAMILAIGGVYFCYNVLYKTMSGQYETENEKSLWNNFSTSLLQQAHSNRQNVIVDFTANWCMNCQYNKIAVLNTTQIQKLIEQKNIIALKADLTKPNPEIESLMKNLGSRSIPFFAVFPGDNPYSPIVMRDILSKKDVVNALKELPDKN